MKKKRFVPHNYQRPISRAIRRNKRVNVWASMGSGKTPSTLHALNYLFMLGLLEGPVLICAPLLVASVTWPNEAKKWKFQNIPRIVPIVGTPLEREIALKKKSNVYSINYENIPWIVDLLGKEWPFIMVISDESTRLKSYRSKGGGSRARKLAQVAFDYVRRFVNLTGTPAPNGIADLWGQQYFIDGGLRLGTSYSGFQDRYFRPVSQGGHGFAIKYEIRKGADDIVKKRLANCTVSVDAAKVFGVKKPRHVTVEAPLPRKARKAYEAMEEEFFAELEDGEIEALNTAARSSKLLQIAAGAVYLTEDGTPSKEWERVHDAKLDALESIIEELAGAPLLVAYHWKHDLARIMKRFPHAVKLDKKAKTQELWNKGKISLLCAHPSSAGHGLNLQDGGCDIAFFSEWYDAETHMQIIERIGPVRQYQAGHPRTVTVFHIRAPDTIDVAVAANLSGKISVDESIREYMRVKQDKARRR